MNTCKTWETMTDEEKQKMEKIIHDKMMKRIKDDFNKSVEKSLFRHQDHIINPLNRYENFKIRIIHA